MCVCVCVCGGGVMRCVKLRFSRILYLDDRHLGFRYSSGVTNVGFVGNCHRGASKRYRIVESPTLVIVSVNRLPIGTCGEEWIACRCAFLSVL